MGLEVGVEDADPGKCPFLGVVGGEAIVGLVGVVGEEGVLSLTGVAGGLWADSSALTVLFVVPFGCSTSGLSSSSSFFSTESVLEEDVPTEAFLGLFTGKA